MTTPPSPDRSPSPRDAAIQAVARHFPSTARSAALRILDRYGGEPHHREPDRVKLAVLSLSQGSLEELERLVAHACHDYRDVLLWRELAAGARDAYAEQMLERLGTPEATPERLTLLTETVPGARRVAVLWHAGYASHRAQLTALEARARELGVGLQAIPLHLPDELDGAFAAARSGQAEAMLVLTSTMQRHQWRGLADRARMARIPAIGEFREFPVAGGLMSYGPTAADQETRAALSTAALLRRLEQEPSEAPTTPQARELELVINLATARALERVIPRNLLDRANVLLG